MKRSTHITIGIFVLGLVGILGYYFYSNSELSYFKSNTTDAKLIKGNITIGIDNWIGYFPLCSPKMKNILRSKGYLLNCIEDGANYEQRMEKLKKKKYDFAVATVDSFLSNGKKYSYPGSIVMVIDESSGGDAIISKKALYPNIDSLKNPDASYKIAYTPQSPSEHLLKSIAVHFDIDRIKNGYGWKKETDGSEDALKKLKKGKVDIAVLWEPDVSKALEDKRFTKILGTEDTKNLIVDILLAGHHTVKKNAVMVKTVLRSYFLTLKYYQNNKDVLEKDIESTTKLKMKNIKKMLKGVSFVNLFDNATKWFGVSKNSDANEGLINTIESTVQTQIETKVFSSSPIPDGNPYILQTRSFVENLFNSGINITIQGSSMHGKNMQQVQQFKKLSDSQWQAMRDVGTLKIRPISFKSGTSEIDFAGKDKLENAISSLKHYPNFRIVIWGHTGLRGERAANLKLSKQRANAVKEYLVSQFGVNINRLRALGFGSLKPLPRQPNESFRAYNYRLPRVELRLVSEVY